jgi:hypothetical protein
MPLGEESAMCARFASARLVKNRIEEIPHDVFKAFWLVNKHRVTCLGQCSKLRVWQRLCQFGLLL